jgi:hypothetical protein
LIPQEVANSPGVDHRTRVSSFRRIASVAAVAAAFACGDPVVPLPSGRDFGSALTLEQTTPLAEIAANPERFTDEVLIQGRISDVCQRKGCWTVVRDGDLSVRVRFKDYGFFVPKDCAGERALIQGVVSLETLSEEVARHYQSESRDGDPDAIRGPQRELGFTASGVRLIDRAG